MRTTLLGLLLAALLPGLARAETIFIEAETFAEVEVSLKQAAVAGSVNAHAAHATQARSALESGT